MSLTPELRAMAFRDVRPMLPGKEGLDAFGVVLEAARRYGLTMPEASELSMDVLASLIHELRLTDKAPRCLRLDGIPPLPPLLPKDPKAELPDAALAVLESFTSGEAVNVEADEQLMWAMAEAGYLSVATPDEFGDVWDVTEKGRQRYTDAVTARQARIGVDEYGDGTDPADEF